MKTAAQGPSIDPTSFPRAVLAVAIGVVHSVERAVVGDAGIRTARGNAWEAICADRDRAQQRAEIRRMVATLTGSRAMSAAQPPTPTSPATPTTLPDRVESAAQ